MLWDDDGNDSTPETPYAFQSNYVIPADDYNKDPDTTDILTNIEPSRYLTLVQRDIAYLLISSRSIEDDITEVISRGILDQTEGTMEPGIPLSDFTDPTATLPIVKTQGVSYQITDAAAEDVRRIEAEIEKMARLLAKAKAAKAAIDQPIESQNAEILRLNNPDSTNPGEVQQKNARADMREIEIQAEIDRLNEEIRTLESHGMDYVIYFNQINPQSVAAFRQEVLGEIEASELTRLETDFRRQYSTGEGYSFSNNNDLLQYFNEGTAPLFKAEYDTFRQTYLTDNPISPLPIREGEEEPPMRECINEADCNTKKMVKEAERDEVAKDSDDDGVYDEVGDLRREAQDALEEANKRREYVSDLERASMDTARTITQIENIQTRRQTALDAARPAINADSSARSIRTALRDFIIGVEESSGIPVYSPAAGLTQKSVANLDSLGDAVFARAVKPAGLTPEQALRAIARSSADTTVTRQTINTMVTVNNPSDSASEYSGNIGEHWRIDLTDILLVESDLPSIFQNLENWNAPATERGGQTVTAFRDGLITNAYSNTRGAAIKGTFKGVYGIYYCDGSSCSALTDSTFADGWYFTPTSLSPSVGGSSTLLRYGSFSEGSDSRKFIYKDSDNDGEYELVNYIDYGMWLTEGDGASDVDINFALDIIRPNRFDVTFGLDVTTVGNSINNLATSATYSGTAQGLSTRVTEGQTASGHFDADVTLNATFNANPRLSGQINNFRSADPSNQGTDHVNSGWNIRLREGTMSAGTAAVTFSRVDHDNDPVTPDISSGRGEFLNTEQVQGRWAAYGYGDSGRRPDGFFGGFTARFNDDGINQGSVENPAVPDSELYDDGAAFGLFSAGRQ